MSYILSRKEYRIRPLLFMKGLVSKETGHGTMRRWGVKLFVLLNKLRGTSTPLTFKICELQPFEPLRALLAQRFRQSDFALRLRRLIQLPFHGRKFSYYRFCLLLTVVVSMLSLIVKYNGIYPAMRNHRNSATCSFLLCRSHEASFIYFSSCKYRN